MSRASESPAVAGPRKGALSRRRGRERGRFHGVVVARALLGAHDTGERVRGKVTGVIIYAIIDT